VARVTGSRKWIGWVGVGTAVFGFIGMFRNIAGAVAPIRGSEQLLLPAFMIISEAHWRWPAARVCGRLTSSRRSVSCALGRCAAAYSRSGRCATNLG